MSGYIFANKAHINNRKKTCYAAISPLHVPTIWWTSPTSGWDRSSSLGYPS